eukprot:CAMPEP_0114563690 /NCGR_PEP_ID=MMETSP0114-20121206/13266_1 /TAXON_ID=31324 /ORGANISM="Goniomonas sp, Strain m" /LENGTH=86 /DNA_ID=CAMNT_0001749597 /DNA_START=6 /DNA_END=264 /DNA_ORIENTATION=+
MACHIRQAAPPAFDVCQDMTHALLLCQPRLSLAQHRGASTVRKVGVTVAAVVVLWRQRHIPLHGTPITVPRSLALVAHAVTLQLPR